MMSRPGWVEGGPAPKLPYSEGETSREAAIAAKPSAKSIRARVRRWIDRQGRNGATDDEIEVASGMPHQTISARRRELVLEGAIVWNGLKRKTRSGRNAKVWVSAGLG